MARRRKYNPRRSRRAKSIKAQRRRAKWAYYPKDWNKRRKGLQRSAHRRGGRALFDDPEVKYHDRSVNAVLFRRMRLHRGNPGRIKTNSNIWRYIFWLSSKEREGRLTSSEKRHLEFWKKELGIK